MKRALVPLFAASILLGACGQSTSSLQLSPTSLTTVVGGAPQTFTATQTSGSGTVVWTLNPASGAGTLNTTTGTTVTYTPPSGIPSPSSAILTATIQGTSVSASATITINSVSASDRNLKTAFAEIDAGQVLAKVAALPLSTWSYKTDSVGVQHLGPMAQDFHAAFRLNGSDNQHIAVVDEGGVALAAIQGLYRQNQQLQHNNKALASKLNDLEHRLAALEAR